MEELTPRRKAIVLVHTFMDIGEEQEYNTPRYLSKDIAKQCALIVVDQIISSREDDGAFDDTLSSTSNEYYTPHPMYLTYWQQVKQEIEKL